MFQEFNGLELKLLRLFYGYTLDEVAISVDKSRQYLHKLETGQTQPTDELLRELAHHFKVDQNIFLLLNLRYRKNKHIFVA
jgi:transcriptional regulator with XRE-family HTH domain